MKGEMCVSLAFVSNLLEASDGNASRVDLSKQDIFIGSDDLECNALSASITKLRPQN